MNSEIVFAGNAGVTISASGALLMLATGAMSRMKLKFSFW